MQNCAGGVAALVWAGDEAGQSRSRMIDVTGQATAALGGDAGDAGDAGEMRRRAA